jgi:hypothetical protein
MSLQSGGRRLEKPTFCSILAAEISLERKGEKEL